MFRCIAAAIFAPVLTAQNHVELEGRYWIPQLSSHLRLERNGLGTDIDAQKDLGIRDTNLPSGTVAWQHRWSRLSFSYTPLSFSGDQNVSRTVVFNGQQYTVGTRIQSDLSIQHLQLNWTYELIHSKDGKFRLGPLVEADAFLMHGRLSAPVLSPPISEEEDLSVGLPAAGLRMLLSPLRRLDIFAQVAGMDVPGYGYFVGSDSGARVRLFQQLFLSAGYRTFNLHVENSPDFFRVQLRGPFVGAGLQF